MCIRDRFGNYALNLELEGILSVTSIMTVESPATAIAAVIGTLPLPSLALLIFLIISVVFLVTTYDSASYTLASVSTREMRAGDNPSRALRLFWAIALGILPITLLFIDGGLKVILSTTIVVSLPLLGLGYIMADSLISQLRADNP